MAPERPVRQSVREIDGNSWLIGDTLLLFHTTTRPSSGCFWSDGRNAFYTLSETDISKHQTRPLSPISPIQLVNDAGDCNAAWRIGEAFLKVQANHNADRTPEHITLNYLQTPANGPVLTFPTPRVLHHHVHDNRYYLFTSRVPGETLEKAWQGMDEATKEACVRQVVEIIKEMAQRESNQMCGVDGGHLSDAWIKSPKSSDGYSHDILVRDCKELEMKCDVFVLHHCDMGPTNVIVDLTKGCRVGIIDWEVTGFVPKEWIRTKFSVSWAMDLQFPGDDVVKSRDWRQRVQLQLEQEGFPEVAAAWMTRILKGRQ